MGSWLFHRKEPIDIHFLHVETNHTDPEYKILVILQSRLLSSRLNVKILEQSHGRLVDDAFHRNILGHAYITALAPSDESINEFTFSLHSDDIICVIVHAS